MICPNLKNTIEKSWLRFISHWRHFQKWPPDLCAIQTLSNISAYKAAGTLVLVSIPMFMMLGNPINMSACIYMDLFKFEL